MRKGTILAAAALAVGMASLGIAAAPANAANAANAAKAASTVRVVPNYTDRTDVQLCDDGANTLCMTADGTFVVSDPSDPDNAQELDVIELNNCGGTVTASPACPFPSGSGLNSKYKGDTIVGITDNATSMAFLSNQANEEGGLMTEALTGNGQVWVQVGDLVGSNANAEFINVYQSTGFGGNAVAQIACDNGVSGQQMVTTDIEDASVGCLWHVVT
jgi:hypothetical protein